MLTLCLHIVFHGSTAKGLGVTVLALYPALLESPFIGLYFSAKVCEN